MSVLLALRKIIFSLLLLALPLPAMAARNYIVVDNQTGMILESHDANRKVQIASLTKIATALVVFDWAQLKKIDLSTRATVSARAVQAGGRNPVGLQIGDTLSLRDLLYAALLASDNIAATALAEHVGARLPNSQNLDPVGNFVSHMNALARTLRMKRTLFLNPTGMDSTTEKTLPHSTAADLARLTRYAYSEADFPFYVSQKTRDVHVFRNGKDTTVQLQNTNGLLGQDNVDGVKTGRTSRAGECLILSAEKPPEVQREGTTVYITPRRLIVVVLGSRNRMSDGITLLRQGWTRYQEWADDGRKTKSSDLL